MQSCTCSRRDFLKTSAIVAGAYIASPASADDDDAPLPGVPLSGTYPETSTLLRISDPARFTVLQLTDSHFFLDRPEVPGVDDHTRSDWTRMVDVYKPNLVAMTGDLWHENPEGRGAEYQANCIQTLDSLGVPWVYTWGNHDQLDDFAKGHDAMHEGKHSLYRGGAAGGNYTVDVMDADSKKVWELICLNTHRHGVFGDTHDWLTRFAAQVSDKEMPRYAFFHIPVKQYLSARIKREYSGISYEGVAFEKEDGSALGLLKSVGGIRGCFVGHDHLNDYSANVEGIDLVFGRSSGWNGYGSDKIRKGGKLLTANCETGSYAWESVFPDGLRWKPNPGDHIEEIIDKPFINPKASQQAAA